MPRLVHPYRHTGPDAAFSEANPRLDERPEKDIVVAPTPSIRPATAPGVQLTFHLWNGSHRQDLGRGAAPTQRW